MSLGEQQRLAFGRILYNKPKIVVLDEATSALDLYSEKAMYELLSSIEGVTYISVGHRPSLLNYHTKKLIFSNGENPKQIILATASSSRENNRILEDLTSTTTTTSTTATIP